MTPGAFGVTLLVANHVMQILGALVTEPRLQLVTQGQSVVDQIV